MPLKLKIKPLHENFKAPKQATDGSGGFDIYMVEGGHIPQDGKVQVSLGFAAAFPKRHMAIIAPRSGVGTNDLLELANTVPFMDADYTGPWLATMRTKDGSPFSWNMHDRLLQFAIIPIPETELEIVDDLDETERGEGGHGSTGR